MRSVINRFRRDERGATATEYAMLLVFIALAIAVGATALGGGINTLFTNIGNEIKEAPPAEPLPFFGAYDRMEGNAEGAVQPPALPPVN
jgi:pilus assembly protein Flp/PilA